MDIFLIFRIIQIFILSFPFLFFIPVVIIVFRDFGKSTGIPIATFLFLLCAGIEYWFLSS